MFSRTAKGLFGKKDLSLTEDSPAPEPIQDEAARPEQVTLDTPLVEVEAAPIIPTPESVSPKIHPSTSIPAPAVDAAIAPAPAPAAPVTQPAPKMAPIRPAGNNNIGEALTIDGNVKAEGVLYVQGTINGDVQAMDVTVHKSGQVNGTITAHMITIEGKVTGNIEGGKVRLSPGSIVRADIQHESLSMADGADFEGSCAKKSAKETAAVNNIDPSILSAS